VETGTSDNPTTTARAGSRRGRRKSALQWVRHTVQALVALYVLLIVIANTVDASWAANLHTICPFGGVANLYTYFTTGGYVAKIHSAVFVMLLALLIGLVFTGKSFCGWICPLGSVQEGVGGIGRRLWPRLYNRVPRGVERFLRYLKYAVLAWVLVQTGRTASLAFQDWDPYYNLFRIWTDEIAWSGYLVVALTLVLSLFVPRAFSRYACPLGAINGLFNSFSFLGIKRDAASCTSCGRCDKACPVNITVSTTSAVRNIECTRCLKCVEACPVNARTGGTLAVRTWFHGWGRSGSTNAGTKLRKPVRLSVFAAIAVAAFALPILITNVSGDFHITKERSYRSAADIKGSTSLEDILQNFDVTKQELYNGLGLPEGISTSTKLKDLATATAAPGSDQGTVDPETVRELVGLLGLSLADVIGRSGVLAERTAEIQLNAGLPDTATLNDLLRLGTPGVGLYLITGTRPDQESSSTGTTAPATGGTTTETNNAAVVTTETAQPPTSEDTTMSSTQAIKGSTTLGQVEDMTGDFQAFLTKFGIPTDEPSGTTLSDLASRYGFEITAVREYLAAQN
jgi:polyferredoxin